MIRSLLAAALLAGAASPALADPPDAGSPPAAAPADLTALVPGAGDLTAAQLAVLSRVLEDEFCYCGCPHTLAGCLREHRACKHAPRMAGLAARLARGGLTQNEILKVLTAYYASFDASRRSKLDVKGYGPPLGEPAAPVTIVEFSDFTCPYCQMLRPRLEEFVNARKDRVKLFYKPFPLASHEHSMEAAETGEWARDHGKFWRMHDLLFEHPHALTPDDLVGYAARVGGDPDDLRAALASGKYRPKVLTSQTEARGAGIAATPTLYFDGRRFELPDYSDAALDFTLADEEEWRKNGGWSRD